MCRLLEVCPSGYYAWKRRPAARRLVLIEQIRQVHKRHPVYGSPRVHRALLKEGVVCSRRQVQTLMRQERIRSSCLRRLRVQTTDSGHDRPVASNVLGRQFRQKKLDRVWVSDITYIPTDQGWLYLAGVLDLCSRRIVGWATADHLGAELATEALEKAIAARRPGAGLLHHSDRGVQYASEAYQAILKRHGITCSMSRRGNCWDNAVKESFFKSLKAELVGQSHWATRKEAAESIHDYIELFYNRQRLHSSLGYRSPVEYERQLE